MSRRAAIRSHLHAQVSALPENVEAAGLDIPEGSLRDWGIAVSLFVLSCLYLRLFYNYTSLDMDEGIILQGAQRVLNGQVVYRDFFSFYTPGSYYWNALLLRVFGESVLIPRMALVVYGGIFAILIYFLARRVTSRWAAVLAAYLVTITCLPYRFMVLHNWDSTLWAFLALYCAVWLLQSRHWAWALATGTFSSLCLLFEQSKGAGLIVGLAVGLLIVAWVGRAKNLLNRSRVVTLAMGLVWPVLLTVAYFALQHSLRPMWVDLLWPLKLFVKVAKLPYGDLMLSEAAWHMIHSGPIGLRILTIFTLGPCLLVPVLPLLALGILVHGAFKLRPDLADSPCTRNTYYVLVCAVLGGLLISIMVVRTGVSQFLYLPPFLLVIAWFVDGRDFRSKLLGRIRPLLILVLLMSFSSFGFALLTKSLNARYTLRTRRGMLKSAEPDPVLTYIQSYVPAGGRLFVYPYQPLYYYLTATENPTSFEYLQPGMHTPEQFELAAGQLAAHPPRFVLFTPSFFEMVATPFPETPVEALAARDPVEDYIFAHYQPCRTLASGQFWHYVFMTEKGLKCPGQAPAQRE